MVKIISFCFLPGGRIGDINVSEGILPSEPFVDLGDGPKIKHSAILAGVAQVGVEVQLLRKHTGCTQLLRELLSECECGKIAVERGVILSGVIQSTKQIQSGAIVVDDVKAKTATQSGTQIQILQSIRLEVATDEPNSRAVIL